MKHYSLYELNQEISAVLEDHMEPSYWVIAEIGQLQVNQKGHCYLDLVEKEGEMIKAKMRGTIWSYTYRNLSAWFEKMTQQTLRPGLKILFNAVVQYHEVYGISLNIRDIDANFTLGERAVRKAEIIEKLKEDGIFEMNKGLPLPLVPQRVAIISSPTAAGFGDFMDQLAKNEYHYHFHAELFQATMQGQEAEASIIAAMHDAFSRIDEFDILVIIRGGGASVDLDCFDGYELSSHVAQFLLPVITGIGHERDETICDLVAHTKMKTPTAVSEFLISGMRNYEEKINGLLDVMYYSASARLNEQTLFLERTSGKIQKAYHKTSVRHEKKLEQLIHSLKFQSIRLLNEKQDDLDEKGEKLKKSTPRLIESHKDKLLNFEKYFRVVEPDNLLKRGFTITRINGQVLKKYANPLKSGDKLETIAEKVIITSEVNQIEEKNR